MNAHHKKSSFRPSTPSHNSFFSAGSTSLDTATTQGQTGSARLWKAIQRVPLGWQLDVTLPSLKDSKLQLPIELEEMIQSTAGYYYCPHMLLSDLFVPAFMQDYMRKGSLIAVSVGDGSPDGETVAIDGRGKMVLSLSKDSYQSLGLTGRKSAFGSLGQRFVVEVQLGSPSFKCGKAEVERVKASLGRWHSSANVFSELPLTGLAPASNETRKFDMLFAYVDEAGLPSPITFPPNVTAHRRHPTLSCHELTTIRIPTTTTLDTLFSPPTVASDKKRAKLDRASEEAEFESKQASVREWIGLAQAGAEEALCWDASGNGDAEQTVFGSEQSERLLGRADVMSWNGLFHPIVLDRIVKDLVAKNQAPFIAISLVSQPESRISHLNSTPAISTGKRPNGKKRKRGRGQGEEDECDAAGEHGWTALLRQGQGGSSKNVDWCVWEGQ